MSSSTTISSARAMLSARRRAGRPSTSAKERAPSPCHRAINQHAAGGAGARGPLGGAAQRQRPVRVRPWRRGCRRWPPRRAVQWCRHHGGLRCHRRPGIPLTHHDCAQAATFCHRASEGRRLFRGRLASRGQAVSDLHGPGGLPTICSQLAAHGLEAPTGRPRWWQRRSPQQRWWLARWAPAGVGGRSQRSPMMPDHRSAVVQLRDGNWRKFASAPRGHSGGAAP